MHRPLVAASLIAGTAVLAYAAVPVSLYSRPGSTNPTHEDGRVGTATPQPAVRSSAQAAEGTLSGQLRDAQGAAIAGAVVDAEHKASTWRGLALTDRDGRFSITGVPPGEITLTVRRGSLEFVQVVTMGRAAMTVSLQLPDGSRQDQAMAAGGQAMAIATTPAPSVAGRVAAEQVPPGPPRGIVPHAPLLPPTSMDAYARVDPSGFRRTGDAPLSTFSVDVDTASYSNGRRFLMEGQLPPVDAVRVEEWINYFTYAYPSPDGRDAFRVSTALTSCPWDRDHQLLRVGVRGRQLPATDTAPRNLVFLVDVSGSMTSRDKLPLVQTSLRMLVDQLSARDRIALVVYAGRTAVVLPSTPGDQKSRIHEALEGLRAGGSTAGASGIQLAYQAAREGFVKGGVNRVVLATDGDFNVGITSMSELTRLIEKERDSGIFLSVLGVGRGNLKDATLEALADRGNGNYAYVDSLQEARRVLVDQIGATLVTIAKDVKLQVEFNPAYVAAYRLIGYENRLLQTEDFADDRKDAGEIGAGHTVTALYEIVPPGRDGSLPGATPLRYQPGKDTRGRSNGELATVSVRHKQPDGSTSALRTFPVTSKVAEADVDTAFASAVAEAALVLRKDPLATGASLESAITRAEAARGSDPGGWRAEFVRLMQLATGLHSLQAAPPTSEPQ